jgi:hypothetical protein
MPVLFPTYPQLSALTQSGAAYRWRTAPPGVSLHAYALTTAGGMALFGGTVPNVAIPVLIGKPRRVIPIGNGG